MFGRRLSRLPRSNHPDLSTNSQTSHGRLLSQSFPTIPKFWIIFSLILPTSICFPISSSTPKYLESNMKARLMKRCRHGISGAVPVSPSTLKGNGTLQYRTQKVSQLKYMISISPFFFFVIHKIMHRHILYLCHYIQGTHQANTENQITTSQSWSFFFIKQLILLIAKACRI